MSSRASPTAKHRPVRTCIACRQETAKAELVRFVRTADGAVRPDPTGKAAGRGAYLHASPECFEIARKRKSLERALGGPVPPEVLNSPSPA
ncbi:MAG TPA: YlxR family protein [Candidatus Dormibacteraeota bacterium]|nr:YlxR family protein [Candidatus Dormibacteraeota bacterium]